MPVTVDMSRVQEEFRALPNTRLQLSATRALLRLRERPDYGLPLGNHRDTGDLSSCRKINFDETTDIPARYRIVYRLSPTNDRHATLAEVFAIGPREGMETYIEAARRLSEESA